MRAPVQAQSLTNTIANLRRPACQAGNLGVYFKNDLELAATKLWELALNAELQNEFNKWAKEILELPKQKRKALSHEGMVTSLHLWEPKMWPKKNGHGYDPGNKVYAMFVDLIFPDSTISHLNEESKGDVLGVVFPYICMCACAFAFLLFFLFFCLNSTCRPEAMLAEPLKFELACSLEQGISATYALSVLNGVWKKEDLYWNVVWFRKK